MSHLIQLANVLNLYIVFPSRFYNHFVTVVASVISDAGNLPCGHPEIQTPRPRQLTASSNCLLPTTTDRPERLRPRSPMLYVSHSRLKFVFILNFDTIQYSCCAHAHKCMIVQVCPKDTTPTINTTPNCFITIKLP